MVREEPIEGTEAGRKDYSQNIEVSSLPIIRSYQKPAYYLKAVTVPANGEVSFSATFDYAHFITNAGLSVSANVQVLLRVLSEGVRIIHGRGYQNVPVEITATFPIDEIDATIENFSSVEVDANYWHVGVKGLEEIEPVYAGE